MKYQKDNVIVEYSRYTDVLCLTFSDPIIISTCPMNDAELVIVDDDSKEVSAITIIGYKERYSPSRFDFFRFGLKAIVSNLIYQYELNYKNKS